MSAAPQPRLTGRVKAQVMDADAVRRSLSRIAHEIVERNRGTEGLVVVGIISNGDVLARRVAAKLGELEGADVPVGAIDASGHRDDGRPRRAGRASTVPPLEDRTVVLVDDVIHHGRTARAAIDALLQFGRPRAIQLAVLVDRGHRQLPIRPDYVGKNVPTAESEHVDVCLLESEGLDAVVIVDHPAGFARSKEDDASPPPTLRATSPTPPQEIRTPPPRFPGDPGAGGEEVR